MADQRMRAGASRLGRAIALTPTQRKEIAERFFSRHSGKGGGPFGLGQAVLDFQAWEIASGRIAESGGSPWWSGVNGLMVLDISAAMRDEAGAGAPIDGWRSYAVDGVQSRLWQAHQLSLHAGLRLCTGLLAREPAAEREFAAAAIDIVDRTALTGSATDSADLAYVTGRYYPASYPIAADALGGIETLRGRTAERLRGSDGEIFADVGLESRRWG